MEKKMKAVVVKNVSKTYKKKTKELKAVNNVSFIIDKGCVFGLLGPNGAGKTTTIKILTTLLIQDEGVVEIMGYDTLKHTKKVRNNINFVFGTERGLYSRLSAYENMRFFADLYKVPHKTADNRIEELLKMVGLLECKDDRVETFSKGMKQRLQIAKGLINDPEVLFMDEPTLGLDPIGADDLRKIITELKSRGKTILLTTHNMSDVEVLCDEVAFISNGIITEQGQIQTVLDKYKEYDCKSIEDVYKYLLSEKEE